MIMRSGEVVAMGDKRLDIGLNRLANHRQGLDTSLALTRAAWQLRNGDAEPAILLGHQDNLELTGRDHARS
jgi:hypothetical protein